MASLSDEISSRRTFAIISHPDAGKTTLTEKLLLYTGSIQTAGSVKGKSSAKHAVSDWMDIEKERGISVTSSVLQFTYNGACVNILDTPGHQDFSEDTYRTLMAADAAVMVIDGAKGVEAQTKKLFKVCTLRHIPIFTFVNKLDHEARDPFELTEEIENVLGINTYPMNWPIGRGRNFRGVFDRQTRRVIAFEGDGHANATKKVAEVEAELGDPAMDELIGEENHKNLMDDIELLDGAGDELALDAVAWGDGAPLPPPPPPPEAVLTPRQALFSPRISLPLSAAEGRICAQQVAPYPPGVPVFAPGERICKKTIAYLKQIGYNTLEDVEVVSEPVCAS